MRLDDGQAGVTSELYGLVCANCGYLVLHALFSLLGDPSTLPKRDEPRPSA